MAHMNGVAAFFIIVIIIVILSAIAYIVFTQLRARRLGLPPPAISSYVPFGSRRSGGGSGGIGGFISSKISGLRNRNARSQTGGYEEPLSSNVRGRGRGSGPLDPDEAWDARVGTEADAYGPYEEEHLAHEDGGYHNVGAEAAPYGHQRMAEPEPYIGGSHAGLDRRYDEEMGRVPSRNPFGDDAEPSNLGGNRLRGISPRPIDTGHREEVNLEESPIESRKSLFHEEV